jgi:uncharacterized protein (TIGR03435 family)
MTLMKSMPAIVAFTGIAFGQTFEVASIRVNKQDSSAAEERRISIDASPGGLIMRNVTLVSCIRWAYDVHDYQITGGPAWRSSERYDISAKSSAVATEPQLKAMLQALLAERFQLALRRESKETAVYVLSVGKNGHRLKSSKIDGERSLRPADRGLSFQNASMSDLEQFLSNLPVMDRPILNRTGLDGRFDFTLTLFDGDLIGTPGEVKSAVAGLSPAAYVDAVERIGLRLESQRVPIANLTIEHAEKPTEN